MKLLILLCSLVPLLACAEDLTLKPEDLPRLKPTEPKDAVATMVVKEDFRVELVAAEPLVVDPVALCFDEFGRMFVVEMRDYSERRDEHLGTIRMLEDTDGDGIFDKSTIFADNLPWPTGIISFDGGVFVTASPDIIYLKDTNGDGKADLREVAYTGFGEGTARLNVQALLNSLTWGPDNRIHGANGGNGGKIRNPHSPNELLDLRGRDFSFDPSSREIRAESGGGQYGMSFDNWGRKYVCSNSSHARTDMFEERYAARNSFYNAPSPAIDIAVEGPAAEVYRISPDERWRVIRTKWRVSGKVPGPIEGGGRPSGYFTGAAGLTVFTGDAWGPSFEGDLFVADCGSNLIHHKKVRHEDGSVIAERPADEKTREFIASRDNWFRPCQFENGPDGNLYFPDVYREVIEHPWSLPEQIKKYIDLNAGNDRGRVYRIVRSDYHYAKRALPGNAPAKELVAMLDHPNGWHRDTASRLIFESAKAHDSKIDPTLLVDFYKNAKTGWGKIHAIRLLDSLGLLKQSEILTGLEDSRPAVRVHALRVAEDRFAETGEGGELTDRVVSLANDKNSDVRYQLALSASFLPKRAAATVLESLLATNTLTPWMRTAVLLSSHECAPELLKWTLLNGSNFGDWGDFSHQLTVIAARATPREAMEKEILGFAGQLPPPQAMAVCEPLLSELPLENARAIARKSALIPAAQRIAVDPSAPANDRKNAIKFLSFGQWADAALPIQKIFEENSLPLLAAMIAGINKMDDPGAIAFLSSKVLELPPEARIKAVEIFSHRPARFTLLDAELKKSNVKLGPAELALIDDARSRFNAQNVTTLVSESRQAVYQKFASAATIRGDATKGKEIFQERCATCHLLKGIGAAVGPDLQAVKTNPKEVILSNIIDPSREIAPKYQAYEAELNDGDSASGFISSENQTSITLKNAANVENVIKRSDLKRLKPVRESIMPAGLEQGLEVESIAGLLEFITN
ncbi:MAG: Cytochrome c [Verrucomicrobiales bacterium]|nr:Cytochrome c [Verrucomicrobiales bacterium]